MPGKAYGKKNRLPREERMKGYKDVQLVNTDYPFDRFRPDIPVVGIELTTSSAPLTFFEHPDEVLYVFGPEDGSINRSFRRHCHEMLYIPAKHCLNLAAAVYVVLYDRVHKDTQYGHGDPLTIGEEDRGWIQDFGDR
jgi:hypothetical protein